MDACAADKPMEIEGWFTIETIRDGPFGPQVVKRERRRKNLVVDDGKLQLLRMAAGLQTNIFDNIAVGKCDTAPNAADTFVKTPVSGSIVTVDVKTMDGRTLQLIMSYPSGVGELSATSINEICIINQNTTAGASAFNRSLITATDKTEDDKLKITYECRVT
jgi:hypothetical protein